MYFSIEHVSNITWGILKKKTTIHHLLEIQLLTVCPSFCLGALFMILSA